MWENYGVVRFWQIATDKPNSEEYFGGYLKAGLHISVRNNSWPLAIFRPISAKIHFDRPTFPYISMGKRCNSL